MNCVIRTGTPDDLPFVLDSWAKNVKRFRAMRISISTRILRRIFSHTGIRLRVAHLGEDPAAILGWAVLGTGSPIPLHYVYVRSTARRLGVARALLTDLEHTRVVYLSAAPKGFTVPEKWIYKPVEMKW